MPDPPSALDRMLRPSGIAVLGASARPGALSRRFIDGLLRHGYRSFLAPVNPKRESIGDLECFPSIGVAAQRHPVDLAIVSLPQAKVLPALEECRAAGAAGAIVFSSGYGEVGEEGSAEQQRLSELATSTGLRIIGPNSPGLINVTDGACVIASGVSYRDHFVAGGVGLIAQSGGVAGLLVERAQDAGVGLSIAVCTGNEADVTAGELLSWFAADPGTQVVALFLESTRRPEDLVTGLATMREANKQVAILRAGATEIAARASRAHTGALAISDEVFDAVVQRHRGIRVHSVDDLIDTAFTLERLGTAGSNRVGIITTSGGAGIIATEAAERAGLELPPIPTAITEALLPLLPDFASLDNPADMSGMFVQDLEIFRGSVAAFTAASEFDAVVIVLTVHPPDLADELARRLIEHAAGTHTPPVVLWIAGEMSRRARQRLEDAGLLVFDDADRCMRALAARAGKASAARDAPVLAHVDLVHPEKSVLMDHEALELLAGVGVPVVQSIPCASPQEAAAAFATLGGTVVVKVSTSALTHKSEVGGVRVGVATQEEAATAHAEVIAAARAAGADARQSILQPTVPALIELIVGVHRDPDFGLVLVVGAGGLDAEVRRDVSRRMLPLRVGEAAEMLRELTVAPLLDGFRGAPPVDVAAVVSVIETLAATAVTLGGRLETIEVNPLMASEHGAIAVDAVALLDSPRE